MIKHLLLLSRPTIIECFLKTPVHLNYKYIILRTTLTTDKIPFPLIAQGYNLNSTLPWQTVLFQDPCPGHWQVSSLPCQSGSCSSDCSCSSPPSFKNPLGALHTFLLRDSSSKFETPSSHTLYYQHDPDIQSKHRPKCITRFSQDC